MPGAGAYAQPPGQPAAYPQPQQPQAVPYAAPGDAYANPRQAVPYAGPGDPFAAPPAGYYPPGYGPGVPGAPPPGPPGYPIPSPGAPYRAGLDRDGMLLVAGMIYAGVFFLVTSVVVLFGGSESWYKVVAALYTMGFYAAIAVCGYVHLKRKTYEVLGVGVVGVAGAAALFTLLTLVNASEGLVKFTGVMAMVAVLGAHTALLLLMRAPEDWFRFVKYGAVAATWLFGLLILINIFGGPSMIDSQSANGTVAMLKTLAITGILDLCATVVAILLWRLALRTGVSPNVRPGWLPGTNPPPGRGM
ncbi:MAG: hypothetical protein KKE36_03125 [Actinobacteria bacterium]|nr:hypothetical protein [Actinomycetota bacterium]